MKYKVFWMVAMTLIAVSSAQHDLYRLEDLEEDDEVNLVPDVEALLRELNDSPKKKLEIQLRDDPAPKKKLEIDLRNDPAPSPKPWWKTLIKRETHFRYDPASNLKKLEIHLRDDPAPDKKEEIRRDDPVAEKKETHLRDDVPEKKEIHISRSDPAVALEKKLPYKGRFLVYSGKRAKPAAHLDTVVPEKKLHKKGLSLHKKRGKAAAHLESVVPEKKQLHNKGLHHKKRGKPVAHLQTPDDSKLIARLKMSRVL